MRVRTEARRLSIIRAAREVFLEQGFDGASMAAISERIGGSKATLYGYFPSKEELFIACVQDIMSSEVDEVTSGLHKFESVREALMSFGQHHLKLSLTPGGQSARRMMWTEGGREGIAKILIELGPSKTLWGRVGGYFGACMKKGKLRSADVWTAAMHFRGLLETDLFDRYFYGMGGDDPASIRQATEDAVDVFMRAYGMEQEAVQPQPKAKRIVRKPTIVGGSAR